MWGWTTHSGRAVVCAACAVGLMAITAGTPTALAGCDESAPGAAMPNGCESDYSMQTALQQGSASDQGAMYPAGAVTRMGAVLAQAAQAGTAAEAAGAARGSAPDAPGNSTDAGAGAAPGLFGWSIPPIRWGGSLTTDIRRERAANQPWRLQQNETANFRAASYVWQPWFAQLSGGLGLLLSKEHKGGGDGVGGARARDTSASAVTGNGDLTLFPVSRFPFNANFEVNDSRASGEPTLTDIRSTRFGVRQNYRPSQGNANYAASVNRSTLESARFGRDTVNALAANMNNNFGAQAFDISGSRVGNKRSNTGEKTALSQLTARHSYRPDTGFTVESLASASSSNFHLLSGGITADNRSQFMQANSFVSWRPDEDEPLIVTGGGRMFRSVIASGAGDTEVLTLSGNVGATYALSRQASVTGSATVTQLAANDATTLLTAQSASATYVGDPFDVRGLVYTWNAAANAANLTGLSEGTRQNLGAQFGHQFARGLTLSEGSQLNFSVGQNLGASFDTATQRSQTLSHSANVSWRLASGTATSAYVSALGADSRTSGAHANHFQMINLQASGQLQFNRNASASGNFTVQGVRQGTPGTPSAGFNVYTSGNLSYFHLRAFDVPRLRYSLLYTINDSQFNTRLQGDVNAPREHVSQSLEQRLDYSVGRVSLRLTLRFAKIEGRNDALIFLRIARSFGGY